MEFLTVGQIVKTVGLKGEVKIYPSTHFRDSRFSKGSHVFLLDDNNQIERELIIKTHRKNCECDNLIFEDINSIEEAEKINKRFLSVIKDKNDLKNGEYFFSDLEDMNVVFNNGQKIGKVSKVEEYNSYATLRVKTENKDVLIPFVKAFIQSVSLETKTITVNYIEGLL